MDTERDNGDGLRPSTPGGDGTRDPRTGRFRLGNHAGVGNPLNRQVQRLRAVLPRTVKPRDLRELVEALLARAKSGDVAAARLILAYSVGRPPGFEPDDLPVGPLTFELKIPGLRLPLNDEGPCNRSGD